MTAHDDTDLSWLNISVSDEHLDAYKAHRAEAFRLLDTDYLGEDPVSVAIAQVHATLALAEATLRAAA